MSFDPLSFVANSGKTIGSMVSDAASGLTSSLNNFVSNLSGSGISLSSIKNAAANKLDSATNFLNGDPAFSRISQTNLALNRSKSIETDPIQAIARSQDGMTTKSHTYPTNLGTDFISIEFSKYDRPGPMSPVNFSPVYTVNLPLPKDLNETHSLRLDPQETGILTALASNAKSIGDILQGKSVDTGQLLSQGIGVMYQGAKQVAGAINVAGVSGEQVLGMAGQYMGAVPNPHISVFFNGVDVRPPMEFSWLLSARNQTESAIIKNIVKEFKKKVLPQVTQGDQNIMSYPHMVRLTLHPWNETNGKNWSGTMPIYKVGLINSITVNYSPNGLSFFNDSQSSPVFVVFSFTFQELEVWTATDYGGGDAPDPAGAIADSVNSAGEKIKNLFK